MATSKLVSPAAARYEDLTQRREKIRKIAFAEAEGAAQRLRDERTLAERTLSDSEAEVRSAALSGPVTAASLAMASYGLAACAREILTVNEKVVEAEKPVTVAREALGVAVKDRMIAERWVERQRVAKRLELELAADRETSDRFGHVG